MVSEDQDESVWLHHVAASSKPVVTGFQGRGRVPSKKEQKH